MKAVIKQENQRLILYGVQEVSEEENSVRAIWPTEKNNSFEEVYDGKLEWAGNLGDEYSILEELEYDSTENSELIISTSRKNPSLKKVAKQFQKDYFGIQITYR